MRARLLRGALLVLSRGDGPDGEATYKIRQRFPKKGPLIRRCDVEKGGQGISCSLR